MILSLHNPDTDKLEKGYLSTLHNAGVESLTLKNNDRFATSQRLLLGEMGYERSELVTSDGVSGSTIVTIAGVTVFQHDTDEPVYVLEYDQIEVWRSTSENGTYDLLSTVYVDVDNEDKVTHYDDTTGSTSSWYKIKYAHSLIAAETAFSDAMQATGYTSNSVGKTIDAVVRRVRDQSYSVFTPEEYIDICNEVNHDLITQTHRPYRFLRTSVTIDTVASQNWVALPADLWKFDRVEFTHTIGGSSRSYGLTPISMERWDQRYNSSFWTPSDELRDVAVDEEDSRLYIGPTPRLGTTAKLQLFYWRKFPEIDSVGDSFVTPNNLIYRYKMLAEYYSAKSESDNQFARLANNYEQKYGAEVVKMQRVNRLDAGTTREIKPMPGYRKRYVL